jgi:UDP-N-acetylglucosamine diphosphorylase/glucosamine-1-phosphate N-acetyltransferase
MNVALFDHPQIRQQLLPFTYTRPVAEIRMGILTITEKWQRYLGEKVNHLTQDYLANKFPGPNAPGNLLVINGGVCPEADFIAAINALEQDRGLSKNGVLLAARVSEFKTISALEQLPSSEYTSELTIISRPWHIFKEAGAQIRADHKLLTQNRQSAPIADKHTIVFNEENVFLEEGVNIKAAILNAENGPIYLGRNSTVEEGAVIRGPFALGEDSTVNAHARMRGDISIGPKCKVGGEVSNSVIFGHSNKGHDGFLGNSVLGEWCNIGAGTNISNLKNNYAQIKVWDYAEETFIDTGEQFCGLMMGDHSKCAINTMFNTGTITGVAANIFGAGFPRTLIPSFSWGGHGGFSTFKPNKVKEMATVSMARRDGTFDQEEENIMNHLFRVTQKFRTWE